MKLKKHIFEEYFAPNRGRFPASNTGLQGTNVFVIKANQPVLKINTDTPYSLAYSQQHHFTSAPGCNGVAVSADTMFKNDGYIPAGLVLSINRSVRGFARHSCYTSFRAMHHQRKKQDLCINNPNHYRGLNALP